MGLFDNIADKMFGDKPKIKDPIEQDQDEKDLVAYIKNKVEEARQMPARIAFESQVVTNTAYLLGFDSVVFDTKMKAFRSLGSVGGSRNRTRVHANLILPTVQNRLSRLCKNPPKYDVRPESMAQEDKDAARLSLKALNNKFDEERINEKRIELYMWMQQAGYAYIKTCWDPNKGKSIPGVDESGEPTLEYEGDITYEVVSPLEIFVDPQAKNIQDAAWVIHAKVKKLSYFRDRYPEKGSLVKEEGAWLLSTQNLNKIAQMNSKGAASTGAESMKGCAIEIAYYERPTKKYPGGRFIVTANGVNLEYKELPIDEIPIVKFDDVKVGGKFHSESIVTHMRPLQDQLNRNMRRKAEFLDKGLNLKFLAPKGHGLAEEALNDSTEILEYNPVPNGVAPQAVTPPQMPAYVYNDNQSLEGYFNQISGISEVSKGQMPSASIPGVGMQILQEADETRIGIVTESNENSWSDVARQTLKYMNKFYVTERYIKESGANSEYTIQAYTKESLRNHTDVICIRGSTLPNSKVLKRQEIINLYTQGLMGDPQDPSLRRRLLQQLEFGDLAGIWEDQMVDDAQIKRDIELLEQGVPVPVHPDDNHQAHFDAKNKLRKTEKFQMYPPEVQALFDQNMSEHKQYLMPPQPMPQPGLENQPPPAEESLGAVGGEIPPELVQPIPEGELLQ